MGSSFYSAVRAVPPPLADIILFDNAAGHFFQVSMSLSKFVNLLSSMDQSISRSSQALIFGCFLFDHVHSVCGVVISSCTIIISNSLMVRSIAIWFGVATDWFARSDLVDMLVIGSYSLSTDGGQIGALAILRSLAGNTDKLIG